MKKFLSISLIFAVLVLSGCAILTGTRMRTSTFWLRHSDGDKNAPHRSWTDAHLRPCINSKSIYCDRNA